MCNVQKMCENKELPLGWQLHFVCSKCKGIMEGTVDLTKKLHNEVETMNRFCYLGDRWNASGGCEVAVTAKVRVGWVRLRKCGVIAWK